MPRRPGLYDITGSPWQPGTTHGQGPRHPPYLGFTHTRQALARHALGIPHTQEAVPRPCWPPALCYGPAPPNLGPPSTCPPPTHSASWARNAHFMRVRAHTHTQSSVFVGGLGTEPRASSTLSTTLLRQEVEQGQVNNRRPRSKN